MIVTNPRETREYVLQSHREALDAPVFVIQKALTAGQFRACRAAANKRVHLTKSGVKGEDADISISNDEIAMAIEACECGLKGWRGLENEAGQPIVYAHSLISEFLPWDWVVEIGDEILNASRLIAAQAKNS